MRLSGIPDSIDAYFQIPPFEGERPNELTRIFSTAIKDYSHFCSRHPGFGIVLSGIPFLALPLIAPRDPSTEGQGIVLCQVAALFLAGYQFYRKQTPIQFPLAPIFGGSAVSVGMMSDAWVKTALAATLQMAALIGYRSGLLHSFEKASDLVKSNEVRHPNQVDEIRTVLEMERKTQQKNSLLKDAIAIAAGIFSLVAASSITHKRDFGIRDGLFAFLEVSFGLFATHAMATVFFSRFINKMKVS